MEPSPHSHNPTPGGSAVSRTDEHDLMGNVPGLHIQKSQSWGMISAALVNRDAGEVDWQSDSHRTTLALTDMSGTVCSNGGSAQALRQLPGMVAFTPAGVSTRVTLPAARFIQIQQTPESYNTIIPNIVRGGSIHFERRGAINDPLISQVMSTIANEMEGGFFDRLLVDALNTALAVQITRRFVDPSAIALTQSNGLSRERLKRVQDYIEAHLDDRLTLTQLAGVACLSPYHFSRSFKEATGVGPQRYVIQRRLERAKTLMRRTNQPLAVIAHEAGFTDQSHLTSIFRRGWA